METKEILSHINSFSLGDGSRLRKLQNYYRGNHPILTQPHKSGKPDNRLVNNFCRAISDSTVGYFLGKPVTYSFTDDALGEKIIDINDYNDEQFVNSRLARDLSVFGRAAELIYFDDDRRIRFLPIDVTSVIPIYANKLDRTLTAAIRSYEIEEFYPDENEYMSASSIIKRNIVEVYDNEFVSVYEYTPVKHEIGLLRRIPHYFGEVPVNFYYNNCDETGDFEPVLTLIDAYNRLQSESVNDFDLFADSYLAITGMGGTDREDIERLREDRVLLLDDGGEASWLTKTVNDTYIENLKSRIARDIYRFSDTVDLSEEILGGGQLSGAAIRYRLLNFENRVSVTERYFKKGLCRRYELICNMMSALGLGTFDWRKINYIFTRNLPDNESDIADTLEKYQSLISKRTILERIPFITDVDDELERIKAESAETDITNKTEEVI